MAASDCDEQFKILLVGESGVGKSSLLLRYTEDTFEDLPPTIGVDFQTKKVTVGGFRVKLTLWDTAGQERFRTLTSAYYRGAHGVLFVYDVTRRESFDSLKDEWVVELTRYSTYEDVVKVVVGNKIDLEPRRVSREEGQLLARDIGALYIESSAKESIGVDATFLDLVEAMVHTPSLCTRQNVNNSSVNLSSRDEAATSCNC